MRKKSLHFVTLNLWVILGEKVGLCFLCLVASWYDALFKVTATGETLQCVQTNMNTTSKSFQQLKSYFAERRSHPGFVSVIIDTDELADTVGVKGNFKAEAQIHRRWKMANFYYDILIRWLMINVTIFWWIVSTRPFIQLLFAEKNGFRFSMDVIITLDFYVTSLNFEWWTKNLWCVIVKIFNWFQMIEMSATSMKQIVQMSLVNFYYTLL